MGSAAAAQTARTITVRGHSPGMASWLTIALVLILVGLLFGVGLFVEAGKVILLVILVLILLGVLFGAFARGRNRTV
jgi:cbb3-type cytochrome oxidase subunit 3